MLGHLIGFYDNSFGLKGKPLYIWCFKELSKLLLFSNVILNQRLGLFLIIIV